MKTWPLRTWFLFGLMSWSWLASLALPALAHQIPLPYRQPLNSDRQIMTDITGSLPFTTELRSTDYIKGLYITYYGMGSDTHRARAQELLETTELNAIVMDVKGDFGWLPYNSDFHSWVEAQAVWRPGQRSPLIRPGWQRFCL